MKKKDKQTVRILNFLTEHGSITQREAIYLGCYRLSARVKDLRDAGYAVETELVTVDNADGSKARIARYRLKEVV